MPAGRPVGVKHPKPPTTESEELVYYRALHFLRESVVEEDAANDALISVYRKQCEYITAIRPFMGWEDIASVLGIPRTTVLTRFRNYTKTGVENDEPE